MTLKELRIPREGAMTSIVRYGAGERTTKALGVKVKEAFCHLGMTRSPYKTGANTMPKLCKVYIIPSFPVHLDSDFCVTFPISLSTP